MLKKVEKRGGRGEDRERGGKERGKRREREGIKRKTRLLDM